MALSACGDLPNAVVPAQPTTIPDDQIVLYTAAPGQAKVLLNPTLSQTDLLTPTIPDPLHIAYVVDPGPLGTLTNSQAVTLLQEMLHRWSDSAGVDFQFQGMVSEDITVANFEEYWGTTFAQQCPDTGSATAPVVVVFDADGSLFASRGWSALGGINLQCSLFKFADNTETLTASLIKNIVAINGATLSVPVNDPDFATRLSWTAFVMLHEVGHALGLDHSSVAINGPAAPVMRSNNHANPQPHPDDIAWVSYLYPPPSGLSTGSIAGNVHVSAGPPNKPMLAAITAINPTDPRCEVFGNWAKIPCDANGQCTGDFLLPNLPPGNYLLLVDQIQSGGLYTGHPWELWNQNDTDDEPPWQFDLVPVIANAVTDIESTLSSTIDAQDSNTIFQPLETLSGQSPALADLLQGGSNARCQEATSTLPGLLGIVVPDNPDVASPTPATEITDTMPSTNPAMAPTPGGCVLRKD